MVLYGLKVGKGIVNGSTIYGGCSHVPIRTERQIVKREWKYTSCTDNFGTLTHENIRVIGYENKKALRKRFVEVLFFLTVQFRKPPVSCVSVTK